MPSAIGVDIGGTKASFGAVTAGHDLVGYHEVLLPGSDYHATLDLIVAETARLARALPDGPPAAVGVAVAGWLTEDRGSVRVAINLGWTDRALGRDVTLRTGHPTTIANDGDAAAWAEWILAGRDVSAPFVALTLGTDVGGGVIVDGRLVTGGSGVGAELGHITVDPRGPLCVCGNHGCLAVYASGTAMLAAARRQAATSDGPLAQAGRGDPLAVTGRHLTAAASAGDVAALAVITQAAQAIAFASVQISRVLDHGMLVLGGGAAGIGEPLRLAVVDALDAMGGTGVIPARPVVRLAQSGNAAGVRGAADLALVDIATRRDGR